MQDFYPTTFQGLANTQNNQGFASPNYGNYPGNQPYGVGSFDNQPYDNQPYDNQPYVPQPYDYLPATCPISAPVGPLKDYAPSKGCGSVEGIYCNQALANIIFQCQATCEYATTHLKLRSDTRARRDQLIVLRDCADICGTNCKFVPRGSAFDRQTVAVCACICEACANECSRFNDPLSQQCARICCQCAKACRAFVRGTY